jgi:hypothetical protein
MRQVMPKIAPAIQQLLATDGARISVQTDYPLGIARIATLTMFFNVKFSIFLERAGNHPYISPVT